MLFMLCSSGEISQHNILLCLLRQQKFCSLRSLHEAANGALASPLVFHFWIFLTFSRTQSLFLPHTFFLTAKAQRDPFCFFESLPSVTLTAPFNCFSIQGAKGQTAQTGHDTHQVNNAGEKLGT